MSKFSCALVGCGVIGKRHLLALSAIEPCALAAIVDPTPVAQQTAQSLNVPWFADCDNMLREIRPDGVIVATPTEHHLAPTLAALSAGAHVLVEKPVMATVAEAEQVVAHAAAVNRQVLVGHQRRYYAQVHKARELVRGGALGQLVAVSGQWSMRKPADYYEPAWRKQWRAGPVLTNLIHEIDYLRYICGEIVSLSAETANGVQGFEKEDAAALVMRFDNGALGTFILSDQCASPWSWEFATGENAAFPKSAQNAIRFMGTNGALDFPNLVHWHHGNQPADWLHAIKPEAITQTLDDAYVAQLNHFCAVMAGTELPRISAEDATQTLRATVAVYQAAEQGKRICL